MPDSRRGQKVRLEDVRRLEEELDALPEQPNHDIPKTEAIRILLPKIQLLQSRGYSLSDIAERLTAGGVPMKAATLTTYLRREGVAKKRSKPKKRTSGSEQTAEQAHVHKEGPLPVEPNTTRQPAESTAPQSRVGTTNNASQVDSPRTPIETATPKRVETTAAESTPSAPTATNEPKPPGQAEPKRGGNFVIKKDTPKL